MRRFHDRSIAPFFLAVALIAPFPTQGEGAGEAFISVGDSGQPPSTGTSREVVRPSTSSQSDTERAQAEIERIKQKADQMAAERKQREQQREAAKDEKERREVACAASRSRLEQLESQPPNRRLIEDPDGTPHRVTAEEMQQLLSAAKRQVAEDCDSLK